MHCDPIVATRKSWLHDFHLVGVQGANLSVRKMLVINLLLGHDIRPEARNKQQLIVVPSSSISCCFLLPKSKRDTSHGVVH
jgi:hypothetical protein